MLIIGNGESRAAIDIDRIDNKKIGCNAIHRDFFVDHLVCVDRRALTEAVSSDLPDTQIWTREEYLSNRCKKLPDVPQGNQRADQPRHWGSGPYAILLATEFSSEIHIIGFDLYGQNSLINNVYKGTTCYADPESRAVDPRYWIYQIGRIFLEHPDKYFVIYNTAEWILPTSWFLENVKLKNLDSIRFTI